MLQWPFPWRRDWNIQNLKALITGECGTSQLSQLYLHTCRKMLSTRLTGSSSHLRFTLDHEKMLHWKHRESSPRRERERERVWTCPKGIKAKDRQGKPLSVAPQQTGPDRALPVATRPNSWNLSLDSELIKTAQKSRATTGVPTGVSCSPQRVSPWSHHPSFA